ncbi:MAG TPA: acyloxyacyl hydrolase [Candidatus Limnocylindrales bacterium]|nr:acyloxyacyl hydrolase [Candidatus Limnocylindrales bacterium]
MTSRSLTSLGIAAALVAALIAASFLVGALTSSKAHATALTPARGMSVAQVSAGSVEFSPTVSFTHQNFKREGYGNVDHFTQLDVRPTVGFCLTDHYEVTGGFLARHQEANGTKDTALGATAGLTYNFSRHGSVIPFVSLGFGALFYDGFTMDRTAVLAPTIAGGARVPVGSKAAVNMSLAYQHESNADGEFNASANRILASVGVSLFPWRTK